MKETHEKHSTIRKPYENSKMYIAKILQPCENSKIHFAGFAKKFTAQNSPCEISQTPNSPCENFARVVKNSQTSFAL